ncbi:hypothetical protein BST11_02405 [Mycobacterium alsense]|nr:hypothetical protein [Mycobacterium alsense]OQZ93571.1 hypothetical protein BST11_02405 [Mycobacterium alsense]
MSEPSGQRRSPTGRSARRTISAAAAACDIAFTALLCTAILAALLTNSTPEKRTVAGTLEPTPASQPVRQQGKIVAVSADSVTARSANGYTQTYLVTPNTAFITRNGIQRATASAHFAINDRVDIVGTIRNGTATATAVADRDMTEGAGPPMDAVVAQSVGATH